MSADDEDYFPHLEDLPTIGELRDIYIRHLSGGRFTNVELRQRFDAAMLAHIENCIRVDRAAQEQLVWQKRVEEAEEANRALARERGFRLRTAIVARRKRKTRKKHH